MQPARAARKGKAGAPMHLTRFVDVSDDEWAGATCARAFAKSSLDGMGEGKKKRNLGKGFTPESG